MTQFSLPTRWASISDHTTLHPRLPLWNDYIQSGASTSLKRHILDQMLGTIQCSYIIIRSIYNTVYSIIKHCTELVTSCYTKKDY